MLEIRLTAAPDNNVHIELIEKKTNSELSLHVEVDDIGHSHAVVDYLLCITCGLTTKENL